MLLRYLSLAHSATGSPAGLPESVMVEPVTVDLPAPPAVRAGVTGGSGTGVAVTGSDGVRYLYGVFYHWQGQHTIFDHFDHCI